MISYRINKKISIPTIFNIIILLNGIVESLSTIDQHLEKGKRLLATGQLADALTEFHAAIDGDPNNYLSFYRRGTVYLAMGKFKSGLSDLNRVIELKPDFDGARMQRANVLLKKGSFKEAIDDYQTVIKHNSQNSEAHERIELIYSLLTDLSNGEQMVANHNFYPAIEIFTKILETSPWSTDVHQYRADCYLSIGETSKAILDISALSKLIPDNTEAFYKLSELHYSMGEAELALNDIRECLRLDPDIKKCSNYYKMLRKLNKLIERMTKAHDERNYGECVSTAETIKALDRNSMPFYLKCQSFICRCQTKNEEPTNAIDSCSEYLKHNPNDAETLYNRAQSYILDEQLEKAQSDCMRADEIENSQRTEECKDRINKLIRQSKKRDYYKILGLKRSADQRAIMKAYRKLAKKWHPDNYADKTEKEKAQKVFIDIAAAKEVLSDPEKRQKFDNGIDPLDAEENANGGHNPFHGGFNPFGNGGHHFHQGGGFNFKFKFN